MVDMGKKKKVCLWGGILVLLLGSVASVLVALLKHEPSFYERAAIPESDQRRCQSDAFFAKFSQMMINVGVDREGDWHFQFSETELNSFFEEGFVRLGEADNFRKLGISQPRIVLEDDQLRLAFRYGSGWFSTVVSLELRLWAPKEANLLAVEVRSRRAGGLPISSLALLKELSELAKRHNIDVTAYRYNGNPVALVRFQAGERARPSMMLSALKIAPGSLTLSGQTVDLVHPHDLPAGVLTPAGN
jgi:hypothetical protein